MRPLKSNFIMMHEPLLHHGGHSSVGGDGLHGGVAHGLLRQGGESGGGVSTPLAGVRGGAGGVYYAVLSPRPSVTGERRLNTRSH